MAGHMHDLSKTFFKRAGIIGVSTLISRILGFLRDAVIAMAFGAGLYSDIFFLCFRIPNLLRKLFSEGVLSISFIPVYTECLAKQGKKRAFEMARSAFFIISIFVSMSVIAGVVSAPFFVKLILPQFKSGSYQFALIVLLSRIMMPYILCVSLLALCMGILNSMGNFAAPAAAPVVLNIVIIFFALIISPRLKTPVAGLAIGVTAGGVLQLAMQIPFVLKTGFRFFKKNVFFDDKALKAGKKLIPAMVGASGFQINIFISTIMASNLACGSISYLYYADRLVQFPLALFAVSGSIAIFPAFTEKAALGKLNELTEQFTGLIKLVFFITIPSMAGLIVLRKPIVSLLFQYGAFDLNAAQGTGRALFFLCTGLWAFAGTRLFVNYFYALSDTATPFKAGLVSIGINIVLSFFLMQTMGYQGLALSISISAAINFFLLLKAAFSFSGSTFYNSHDADQYLTGSTKESNIQTNTETEPKTGHTFYKKELAFDKVTNILFMLVKISDFLRHRSAVQPGPMTVIKDISRSVCRSVFASLIMYGTICFALSFVKFEDYSNKTTILFAVTGCVILGIGVYTGACAAMNSPEFALLKNIVYKK